MRLNTLSLVILAFGLTSCHTIRPTTEIYGEFQQSLKKNPSTAGLILDENYRSYISKDRGNAVADPQKYLIGESLTPLTISFFQESYKLVNVYNRFPQKEETQGESFFIQPAIAYFENDVDLTRQEILLILETKLFDQNLVSIIDIESRGKASGGLGFFGSSKSSSRIVGRAMQESLLSLIEEIEKNLPS